MKNCSREKLVSSPSRLRCSKVSNDKRIEIDVSVSNNSHRQNQRPPQQAGDAAIDRPGPIISLPINCDDVTYAIVPGKFTMLSFLVVSFHR